MPKFGKKRIIWINLQGDKDTYSKFRLVQGIISVRSAKETLKFLLNYYLEKENLREKIESLLQKEKSA